MVKIAKIENNVVKVEGKLNYKQNQYFQLGKDVGGFVISAKENEANLLVVGDVSNIDSEKSVKIVKNTIDNIELYPTFFGSIITPFGKVLNNKDDKKETKGKKIGERYIFSESPSLLDREKLKKSFETGLLLIDGMIPIGKGQRELIIGDRASGKTTIALSAIINQSKEKKVKSIYVSIGQKRSSVSQVYKTLEKHKALENTIIMFANPDSVAEKFLAPNTAIFFSRNFSLSGWWCFNYFWWPF